MKRMSILLFLALAVPVLAQHAGAQTASCVADVNTAGTAIATGITGTTYSDTTITDGGTYGYLVTSNDPFGYACSNLVLSVQIPTTGTHTVSLSWTASTTSGVTYSVFRAPPPTAPSALAAMVN